MAVTSDQIQGLYIAYFNRPADFFGLQFWTNAANNNPGGVAAVANAFAASPEYTNTYAGMSTAQIIDSLYMNLFGRHAELDGIKFWGSALTDGRLNIGNIAYQIMTGAQDTDGGFQDATAVKLKIQAAGAFYNALDTTSEIAGYSGDAANAIAKAWLTKVVDQASLDAAISPEGLGDVTGQITGTLPENQPKTFTLTSGVDTVVGGAGNDTINATGATLTALDSIDGGAGVNTLNLVDAAGVLNTTLPASMSIKNIQNMNVTTVKSLGSVFAAPTAAVAAKSQIDSFALSGNQAGEAFVVTYGGVSLTTAAIAGAGDDAAARSAVVAAINQLAGSTVASIVGNAIVITGAAGVALPVITIAGNDATTPTVAVKTPLQTAAAAVAATAGSVDAVYDVSGIALSTFTANTNGGDNLNAAATTDVTVTDVASTSTTKVAGGKSVTITQNGTAGAVVVDGVAGTTTITQNTAGNVTVGGNAVVAGAVVVTDTAQGAGSISIKGGTTVNVTTTTTSSNGAITVGGAGSNAPTGAVSITENLSPASSGAVAGGLITVTGGTTVTVNQVATQPLATATLAGAVNATTTQSNVVVHGNSTTTAVTVNQSAAVTPANSQLASAGSAETAVVQFTALAAAATLTIAGLTITAPAGGLTAKQVAAAFASLATGTLTGWTTGAVSGANLDTVTFTASAVGNVDLSTQITGAAATVISNVDGVGSTTAGGKGGVVLGTVTIDAGTGVASQTISTVTLSNYGASTINSDALTKLTLGGASGTLGITNTKATSLDLTLNKLTGANAISAGTAYTSLKVHTATGDSTVAGISAANVLALTVDGSNALNLTSAAGLSSLKTITVSGAAGLTADVSGLTNITDVNASASTGANVITLKADATTFEGGSGNDIVTIDRAPTVAISGGAGVDTLVLNVAAATFGNPSGNTFISGFETLGLAGSAVAGNYDATGFSHLTVGAIGAAAGFQNVAAGVDLTITASPSVAVTYALKDATGTADSLTLALKGSAAISANVTASGIETVALSATNTSSSAVAGATVDTLNLTDTALKAITVTGNTTLNLGVASATLASIDASGMTGGINVSTSGGVAAVVKGGATSNMLTATGATADTLIGGASADVLTANSGADTLTGNGGNDKFIVSTATANVNTYTTITDLNKGDILQLANKGTAEVFNATKVTLGATAVFQDFANAAVAAGGDSSTNAHIGWFQFAGDTYVVESLHNGATVGGTPSFVNGTDLIVKLTGLVDLSTATLLTDGAGNPQIIVH